MTDAIFAESLWSLNPDVLGDSASHVQGHAEFKAGSGATIELPLGCLIRREPVDGVITYGIDDTLTAEVAYGYSQRGEWQTAIDVVERGFSRSHPGMERQRLHASELYVTKGRQPVSPDPPIIGFFLDMAGLREWVGFSPFTKSYSFDADDGALRSFSLVYAEEVPEVIL